MLDFLTEIYQTIKQNKLRATMTGFSVAWGIFMLIILLGAGSGMQHGMEFNNAGISSNAVFLGAGQTQVAFQGIKAGKKVQFKNDDYVDLKNQVPGIESITGRVQQFGIQVSYGNEYGGFLIEGVLADLNKIVIVNQLEGRFLNEPDLKGNRKVAVISLPIRKSLFKDGPAIGQYIKIAGVSFVVVGVTQNVSNTEEKIIYIPLTTSQMTYNGGDRLTDICLKTSSPTAEASKKVEEGIRRFLAAKHRFDYDDKNALSIYNNQESVSKMAGANAGIKLFIWIISIMTIISGIMGVSNIMIILVKERRKEIGIRKAIGATPWSIIRLVLSESVFITIISGFLGLVAGMGCLALISSILVKASETSTQVKHVFFNPTADVWVAIAALAVLVISGLCAGYIPASQAASIKPVEALYDE